LHKEFKDLERKKKKTFFNQIVTSTNGDDNKQTTVKISVFIEKIKSKCLILSCFVISKKNYNKLYLEHKNGQNNTKPNTLATLHI
jgi:copper homeostasis protein CutC